MEEHEDEEACYCETDDECEEYTITLGAQRDAEIDKENGTAASPPVRLGAGERRCSSLALCSVQGRRSAKATAQAHAALAHHGPRDD